jgi:hypothetical protein
MSIRDCIDPPSHSWLGGQNGEEGETEDEVSGKEDGQEDQA